MQYSLISCAALACTGLAQIPSSLTPAPASAPRIDRVVHDEPGDGHLWARGSNWKASFGAEGFVYYPFVAGAERTLTLQFRLAAVRVGGVAVDLVPAAVPSRDGDRVVFDRGAVSEIYDLRSDEVEQTFVVATTRAGDIEVELTVDSDLPRNPRLPGLRFGVDGTVEYGEAFVVDGTVRRGIATSWTGSSILLRVPAALRGSGPVVIDPILTTRSAAIGGAAYAPDVAWDETNQRYLIVYEHAWSATDHDIWTEMFDADGNLIPSSAAAIDMSNADWTRPRVANIDVADRFVVAAEVAAATFGGRHMIYARTRHAGGTTSISTITLLSDPTYPGDNFSPAVGADQGSSPGRHDALVVWTNGGGSDYNAHARLVDGNGQPVQGHVIVIADGANQLNTNVQVSRSNGNGVVSLPNWFTVFSRYEPQSGWNVYGRLIGPTGLLGATFPLDLSTSDDLYPRVSSPVVGQNGATQYLVTYERQSPQEARAILATFTGNNTSVAPKNLATEFGLPPLWVRAESDGARFVVTAGTAQAISVCTLAPSGNALLLQDGPLLLGASSTTLPEVASQRSSGGLAGEYGISILRSINGQSVPALVRYAGQTSGATATVLPTACNALQIAHSGATAIGAVMDFTLANYGAGLPVFAFGAPRSVPQAICPACLLGLRSDLPTVTVFDATHLAVALPPEPTLVGATFAVQGFAVGAASCLGALAFSDTVVFTVR
ncbi:MAG: hypothetical protein KDE27_08850 [Planctomycetes bacterium]|nr:hypothetical protein [Planctomycetota bacterium]